MRDLRMRSRSSSLGAPALIPGNLMSSKMTGSNKGNRMLRQIAIIGAGTMGTGIAVNAAMNGVSVILLDTSTQSLERATPRMRKMLDRHCAKGRLSDQENNDSLARIAVTSKLETVRSAPLVIEAVYENFDVKTEVLTRLGLICAVDAVIATNTSALQVSALAKVVRNPGRFLGMHYFSPADSSPVVELIQGDQTSAEAIDCAKEFLVRTKRDILVCKDSPGFAINRFFVPFLNAAAQAVDAGLGTVGQINAIGRELTGCPIGPFEVMNFIKPEIVLHAQCNLGALGDFYQPAAGLARLVEKGEQWQIEDEPLRLEDAEKARRALQRGILIPAAALREEGVAHPADIDRCAKSALKWANGPFSADWAENGEVSP
ncbi:3-hydroxyacyl-CoA dehydrogenase family protein [Phaeobacter sp. J2-8]|uniref:3-hydroxyacyl-CoA dehydrogenase family protein n=1 Tax=Phaeobacter sp. J2-8 TaxID=2931394 RepID=UPI001FD59123|nr:3-hydroxyacyl-CoA dehydrogenase family protein [Phaeobacter sp. J2-8]